MTKHIPAHLRQHCTQCGLLVPADSPESDLGNCEPVVRGKLYHFYRVHSKAQHLVCATACWNLIHDEAILCGLLEKLEYEYIRTPNAIPAQKGH